MKKTFVALLVGLVCFVGFELSVVSLKGSGTLLEPIFAQLSGSSIAYAQVPEYSESIYLPLMLTSQPDQPAGVELTAEERYQAIQSIQNQLNLLLPGPDVPPDQRDLGTEIQILGQTLSALPQVVATVVDTNTLTVHAVLSDGLVVTVINNRPSGAEVAGSASSDAHSVRFVEAAQQQSVPGRGRAAVVNFDGGNSMAGSVRALFRKAGYTISGLGAGINDMKRYSGLGALYIDTHGTSFRRVTSVETDAQGAVKGIKFGRTLYGLQTSSQISATTLRDHVADLRDGSILVSVSQGTSGWTAKLAVSEIFIAKYWQFEDAVVMIHSCFGGSGPFSADGSCSGACDPSIPGVFDPTPLRQAMINAGAEVVVSFDNYTNADIARPNILFLFDRLLGTNQEKPKEPPLRPFGVDEVRTEMDKENLLTFNKPSYVLAGFGFGGNDVTLTFDVKDSKIALAPSIKFVDITDDSFESQGKLELTGDFGSTMGTAELDGAPVTIESWAKDKVEVRTPFSGNGAAGDLIVKGPDNVKSNPVPITEWIGNLTLTYDPDVGSLEAVAELDLHFRADLHKYRDTLDGMPQNRVVESYISGGSEGKLNASGTHVEDDLTRTWTGGGELTALPKQAIDIFREAGVAGAEVVPAELSAAGNFGGFVSLDPENNRVSICLHINGSYLEEWTGDGQSGSVPGVVVLPPTNLTDRSEGILGCIDTTLNADYTIPAGQRNWRQPGVGQVLRLKWSDIKPVSPPTEKTPG